MKKLETNSTGVHENCKILLPEVDISVVIGIESVELAQIGEGLNVLNTRLKIIEETPLKNEKYVGIPTNELSEDKFDKASKFQFDKPASLRVKTDEDELIDVFAEPIYVRYSEKYVSYQGTPHYNITTMSGAKFVQRS